MGHINRIIRKVKTTFDPNNVSNPPEPLPIWTPILRDKALKTIAEWRSKRKDSPTLKDKALKAIADWKSREKGGRE
jgi:hypothetical protein